MLTPIDIIYSDLDLNASGCLMYFNTGSFSTGTSRIINQSPSPYSDITGSYSSFAPSYLKAGTGIALQDPFYVTVDDARMSLEKFSIVASTVKTGLSEDIIVGCFRDGASVKYGFNIGFNHANRFFVEGHSQDGFYCRTSSQILSEKNYWAFVKNLNQFSFYYFDPASCEIKSESWPCDETYFFKDTGLSIDRNIVFGSARYHMGQTIDPENGESNLLLEHFLWQSGVLSPKQIKKIMESFYAETGISVQTYPNEDTGIITGTYQTPVYITGVTGFDVTTSIITVTGVDGSSGHYYYQFRSQIPESHGLYISSGTPYSYKVIGDGLELYFPSVACSNTSGEYITGDVTISGYMTGSTVFDITGYGYLEMTGYILSGYITNYLYNTGKSGTFSVYETGVNYNSGLLTSLNKTAISIIGVEQDTGDHIIQYRLSTGHFTGDSINNKLIFNNNYGEFYLNNIFSAGYVSPFLNGVNMLEGTLYDYYSGYSLRKGLLSGDFALDGNCIRTDKFVDIGDSLFYDLISGTREVYKITESSEYPLADPNYIWILNGITLVSGIDYTGASNSFASEVKEITGWLWKMPDYSDRSISIESGTWGLYTSSFRPHASRLYVNGVRLPEEDYIEHSARIDLISGLKNILLSGDYSTIGEINL